MEAANSVVSKQNNSLSLFVKICLHILGLFANHVPTPLSAASDAEEPPDASPSVNVDSERLVRIQMMKESEDEKWHLLDTRKRSNKVTDSCWKGKLVNH